jgi:hypothetical protein
MYRRSRFVQSSAYAGVLLNLLRVAIPLSGLSPSHFYACPKAGSGFPTSYIDVRTLYRGQINIIWREDCLRRLCRYISIGFFIEMLFFRIHSLSTVMVNKTDQQNEQSPLTLYHWTQTTKGNESCLSWRLNKPGSTVHPLSNMITIGEIFTNLTCLDEPEKKIDPAQARCTRYNIMW